MKDFLWRGCFSHGERFTHRYVFYFYPKIDPETGNELAKGFFRFFGRVKFGKEYAAEIGRKFAYETIF